MEKCFREITDTRTHINTYSIWAINTNFREKNHNGYDFIVYGRFGELERRGLGTESYMYVLDGKKAYMDPMLLHPSFHDLDFHYEGYFEHILQLYREHRYPLTRRRYSYTEIIIYFYNRKNLPLPIVYQILIYL